MTKKLNILTALLMVFAMPMLADDIDGRFIFVDKDGNEITHGSTVNITTAELQEDGTYMLPSGVSVKNVSGGTSTYVKVNYTINRIDNGSYQICFPVTCNTKTAVGSYETSAGSLGENEVRDIQSEWFAYAEGTCNVTLQMELQTKSSGFPPKYTHDAYGPTITLNFVYDPNASQEITGDVNGDGEVTIADVNAIVDIILVGGYLEAADVNTDGEVTVADVNAVIDIILNSK